MKRLSDIPLEIAERLDLPAESVAGVPKLTVTGRRRALVENHCGLLEYSHECIGCACASAARTCSSWPWTARRC